MQAKLDKMSKLINEFAEIKVVVKKGKIELDCVWSEPSAKESFNGFEDQVEIILADKVVKKPKKKSSRKRSSKKNSGEK